MPPHSSNSNEEALLRQIAEHSKTEPLFGAKVAGHEVTLRLLNSMKSERGVHFESLFCALGSLAGYSCQASVRSQAIARGLPEAALLITAHTTDGRNYFFGDNLNKPLAESQNSVWSLASGAAQSAGCVVTLDLGDIFRHNAEVLGTPSFGSPRIPERHKPQELPLNYLRALWPALKPMIMKFCPNPEHWPILFGLSIQEVIAMAKRTLDPCVALLIVMECAIPMSKVDLSAP
jgi:hypothetical protein